VLLNLKSITRKSRKKESSLRVLLYSKKQSLGKNSQNKSKSLKKWLLGISRIERDIIPELRKEKKYLKS